MRITQGYVSKSVMDFPFHTIYRLDDYNSWVKPSVFFGMYRFEDHVLWDRHDEKALIFWTGQDAITFDLNSFNTSGNVTAHPPVKKHFDKHGIDCKLVKPSSFLVEHKPRTLGSKIYAYCPHTAPDYHGKKIIDELRCGGYEIIIGDGQWTQDQWRNSQADYHYNQCFIGLCLSDFAGGGTSIIEMGLRGMKVVTNVFDLPNCIPWKSISDIVTAIDQEENNIGSIKSRVAQYTWKALDHTHEWLEI